PPAVTATFTVPQGSQTLNIPAGENFTQTLIPQNAQGQPLPSQSARNYINSLMTTGRPMFVAVDNIERAANPRGAMAALSAVLDNQVMVQQGGVAGAANLQYGMTLQDQVAQTGAGRQIIVDIPNPANGGMVGRISIGEDINPLPRDRIIFNYD